MHQLTQVHLQPPGRCAVGVKLTVLATLSCIPRRCCSTWPCCRVKHLPSPARTLAGSRGRICRGADHFLFWVGDRKGLPHCLRNVVADLEKVHALCHCPSSSRIPVPAGHSSLLQLPMSYISNQSPSVASCRGMRLPRWRKRRLSATGTITSTCATSWSF